MSTNHSDCLSPALEALHLARSALTVVSGRVARAQQRIAMGDSPESIARDLTTVPGSLEDVAAAVDQLAQQAISCEAIRASVDIA
jgi:hypothetical protein